MMPFHGNTIHIQNDDIWKVGTTKCVALTRLCRCKLTCLSDQLRNKRFSWIQCLESVAFRGLWEERRGDIWGEDMRGVRRCTSGDAPRGIGFLS